MRRSLAFVVAGFAALAASAAPDLAQVERSIVKRTNDFRAEQRLSRVEANAALDRAAQGFADYMARTDGYGHTADGRQPSERTTAAGYDHCLVSENISYQFSTGDFTTEDLARRYVEGWKASPGHRRNMLEPHVVHTAAAVARGPKSGRYYAVQLFGRPRASAVNFRVANAARATVAYRVDEKSFTLRAGQERIHTVCTPPTVTFAEAANAEGRIFRPSDGERLRVEGDKRLVVRSSG